MLIACITGPDFQSAKKQLQLAEMYCDGVEMRSDLIQEDLSSLPIPLPIFDCNTIPTYHNFSETPQDLDAILEAMPKAPLVKIATRANCVTDSLRMLDLVRRHPHVAGMCMGPHGAITRILAPVFGSPITFASVGREAAPAQLEAKELVLRYRFRKLSNKTKVYGLLGNPVEQSPSHITHNAFFDRHNLDAVYVKMEVKEEELPLFFDLVKRLDFQGLSVTLPYKEKVFPYVDSVSKTAEEIGAINTITFREKVEGDNTDALGALDVIERRIEVMGKKMVILGAGGSAKAIGYEAQRRGTLVTFCSRRYGNLDQIPPYDLLVSTLPVDVDHRPLPHSVIMDIRFNQKNSPFMLEAKKQNCTLIFGEEMFDQQALYQFARWGLIPCLKGYSFPPQTLQESSHLLCR